MESCFRQSGAQEELMTAAEFRVSFAVSGAQSAVQEDPTPMAETEPPLVFQSTHRRVGLVLALMGLFVAVLAGGGALVWWRAQEPGLEQVLFAWMGMLLAIPLLALLVMLRIHRWTVEAGGIRILERPKVPLTGRRRVAWVPLSEIAALNRRQAGFLEQAELLTRDGRRFLLDQGHHAPNARGIGLPDHAGFAAFLDGLTAAAARAGQAPAGGQVASFWNRPAGLAVQGALLLVSLALAGGAAWALWLGPPPSGRRQGEALAILLLLPVGAGLLLRASLRRRRALRRSRD